MVVEISPNCQTKARSPFTSTFELGGLVYYPILKYMKNIL